MQVLIHSFMATFRRSKFGHRLSLVQIGLEFLDVVFCISEKICHEVLRYAQCFFSGFFRRFRRLNRRNSELDKDFG